MPRILKRPPPKPPKPKDDPEVQALLADISKWAEEIERLQNDQRQRMELVREKGAVLRDIAAAARTSPQTILNYLRKR